jgi:hypothetical protein
MSLRQIAAQTGTTHTTVRGIWLEQCGVEVLRR